MNEIGLPRGFGALPFVEPIRGDQAALLVEGLAKHRALGSGFGARVDGLGLGLAFGPSGNETPSSGEEDAIAVGIELGDGHGLRGGYVEARALGEFIEGEGRHGFHDGTDEIDSPKGVAATHCWILPIVLLHVSLEC